MTSKTKLLFKSLSVLLLINVSDAQFWKRYVDPTVAQVTSITSNMMDTCNVRQAPGFVCMDCAILARCVFINNGWETIPLELCDSGQGLHCNANEQRCSASPGPCNPGQGGSSFSCSAAGIFPDPFNCQSYHVCIPNGLNLIAMNILCGGNSAFNPVSNDCTLNTNHQVCQGSQFTCNNVGDMGAWPLNANIYYICVAQNNGIRIIFPAIFRCPVGQIFRAGQCAVPNGVDGNLFNCQRAGLFADPYDCHYYFHCDGLLRSQHIRCPTGTYFNQSTMGCIRGTC